MPSLSQTLFLEFLTRGVSKAHLYEKKTALRPHTVTVSLLLNLQFWSRGLTSLPPHTVIDLISRLKILILLVGIRTHNQVGLLLLSVSNGFLNVLGSNFFFVRFMQYILVIFFFPQFLPSFWILPTHLPA